MKSGKFLEDPIRTIQESFIPFFGHISDELLSYNELKNKLNNVEFTKEWLNINFPGVNFDNTELDEIVLQLQDLIKAYSFYQKIK